MTLRSICFLILLTTAKIEENICQALFIKTIVSTLNKTHKN